MVIYKLVMLIMVFIFFFYLVKYGKLNNVKRKFLLIEYILVFVNVGMIVVCIFEFIMSLNNYRYILMLEKIFDIILIFL